MRANQAIGSRSAMQPFWESAYKSGDETATFGPPSAEVVALAAALPRCASVLDVGGGDGRHALYLARCGFDVRAIDVSAAAIAKLARLAEAAGVAVWAEVADMREGIPEGVYDLVIAHGCLHLIERGEWAVVLEAIQARTRAGGYNVVAVFTDALEAPADLAAWHVGLFREGELVEWYKGWELIEVRSYILEDEHPGGIRHRHPINKVVARKPG
jgi:tellurite methyltransferase